MCYLVISQDFFSEIINGHFVNVSCNEYSERS